MAFLNLDILLNGLIDDPVKGLQLNRWDHFFFVFEVSLALHLSYLISRRKNTWWIVYTCYGISCVFAPLTQTDYYLKGMSHYYWGFFAQSGILFDIFTFIMLVVGISSSGLIFMAYRRASHPFQKSQSLFFLLGMGAIALLSFGNIPAMNGYELYPAGNYAFIPILLFAYGLFKHNIDEAIRIIHFVLFWTGTLFVLLIAAKQVLFIVPVDPKTLPFILVLFAAVFYPPTKKVCNFTLGLIIRQRDMLLKNALEDIIFRLSMAYRLEKIHDIITESIFQLLLSRHCSLLVLSKKKAQYVGWETWNPHRDVFENLDPINSDEKRITLEIQHPVVSLIQKTKDLITREELEEWLLYHETSRSDTNTLGNIELIQPVFHENQLRSVLLVGPKINHSNYSMDDRGFLHQLGLLLGPYIENARLLRGLEAKVEERTHKLKDALRVTRAKEQEITHINQVVRAVNATLDLDEVIESIMKTLREIFSFDQIGIMLIDTKKQEIRVNRAYGEGIGRKNFAQTMELKFPMKTGEIGRAHV
jgi:hypothetical protein